MTIEYWTSKIKEMCEKAGVEHDPFDSIIDTLASILEKRDEAQSDYEKSGSRPVIKHTNKGGNTNIVKNPILVAWMDLNRSALEYWRELGLTPSALKKATGEALKPEKKSALAEALAALE